jgi:hypothetical protein
MQLCKDRIRLGAGHVPRAQRATALRKLTRRISTSAAAAGPGSTDDKVVCIGEALFGELLEMIDKRAVG